MSTIMIVLWFLVSIIILVTVHEFGHFYVARRCGVKVLRFSVGFGQRLLTWKDRHGTEYALSAIPLGGYVKMLDEREAPVAEEERHLSFNSKSVGQRIAIAAAGPLANVILAFVVYWAIFLNGTVVYAPVIGNVEVGSLAHQSGLSSGQEIIEIDGKAIQGRRDVVLALINRLGETGELSVVAKYPNDSLVYDMPIALDAWMQDVEEPDPLKGLGIEFYYPPIGKVIDQVSANYPAELAGFKPGDELIQANGSVIEDWMAWVKIVRAHPNKALSVTVLRDGGQVDLLLTPKAIDDGNGNTVGQAGLTVVLPHMPEEMKREVHHSIFSALGEASKETKESVGFVFLSLKKLILGEISIKNLSGPIGIAKVAADQAQYGFWAFISFLAQLSIALAVLNILPIPVLDGGHILYCLVEWVKGSPVSERVQLIGLKAGMAMLLCMMAVAFYNDILRL